MFKNFEAATLKGALEHLEAHLQALQKGQQSLKAALPPLLAAQVVLGNFNRGSATLFVKNNAVKQKLFNLQTTMQQRIAQAIPEIQKIQIKINPALFAAQATKPPIFSAPSLPKNKAENLQKTFANIADDEFRALFCQIAENLKNNATMP